MTGKLSKNFHGVGIGPLSNILAVKSLPNAYKLIDGNRDVKFLIGITGHCTDQRNLLYISNYYLSQVMNRFFMYIFILQYKLKYIVYKVLVLVAPRGR